MVSNTYSINIFDLIEFDFLDFKQVILSLFFIATTIKRNRVREDNLLTFKVGNQLGAMPIEIELLS